MTHKSKLNLPLGDVPEDVPSILRNLRGQSVKEIPRRCAGAALRVFLWRVLIHRGRKAFTSNFFQDISAASSTAVLPLRPRPFYPTYGWHWPRAIFPAHYIKLWNFSRASLPKSIILFMLWEICMETNEPHKFYTVVEEFRAIVQSIFIRDSKEQEEQ